MFPALRDTPDDEIRLGARLEEFDDTFLIAGDLWSEVLPELRSVKVVLDGPRPSAGSTTLDQPPPDMKSERGRLVVVRTFARADTCQIDSGTRPAVPYWGYYAK